MKIILTQDLENLGAAGDVVDVKPGYARKLSSSPSDGARCKQRQTKPYTRKFDSRGAHRWFRELREAEQKAEALSKSLGQHRRVRGRRRSNIRLRDVATNHRSAERAGP